MSERDRTANPRECVREQLRTDDREWQECFAQDPLGRRTPAGDQAGRVKNLLFTLTAGIGLEHCDILMELSRDMARACALTRAAVARLEQEELRPGEGEALRQEYIREEQEQAAFYERRALALHGFAAAVCPDSRDLGTLQNTPVWPSRATESRLKEHGTMSTTDPHWQGALPGDDESQLPLSDDELRETLEAMLRRRRLPGVLHTCGDVMHGMADDAASEFDAALLGLDHEKSEDQKKIDAAEYVAGVLRQSGEDLRDLLDGTALAVAMIEHRIAHATGVIRTPHSTDESEQTPGPHPECQELYAATQRFAEEASKRPGLFQRAAAEDPRLPPGAQVVDLDDMRQILAAREGLMAFFEKVGVTPEMMEDDSQIVVGPLRADEEIVPGMTLMQLMAQVVETGQGVMRPMAVTDETPESLEDLQRLMKAKLREIVEKARAQGRDVRVIGTTNIAGLDLSEFMSPDDAPPPDGPRER